MQPTVVMNHHRQTAIIVANSGKKFKIIKLGKGRLTVTTLSTIEIEKQGYQVCNYPPRQAAQSYLTHGAGVSKRARKYLEEIINNQYSGSLPLI